MSHPNKVIVVSTHRPSVLKLCNRIYRISEGSLEEVNEDDARELIFRYADMPREMRRRGAHPPVPPVPPASPAGDTGILPEQKNEGWWND